MKFLIRVHMLAIAFVNEFVFDEYIRPKKILQLRKCL